MTPVAVFQKHMLLRNGAHMCREVWPNARVEQAYNVLLDLTLLVLPVIIMSVAYSRVVHALIFDVRSSLDLGVPANGDNFVLKNYRTIELRLLNRDSYRSVSSFTSTDTSYSCSGTITPPKNISRAGTITTPPTGRKSRRSVPNRIRHSNPEKIRQNKMRVIRMLFVVVLEFFICWTPVYIVLTWLAFHEESAQQIVTPLTKTLFHLLSYFSSCCNPITYCFMNKKFREAFLRVFQCRGPPQSLRERRMQQLQSKQLQNSRDQKRRSTAVSRLSERFNSMASTTSSVLPLDSVRVRNPLMDRCKKLSKDADDILDTGSGSD
ncbi:cholecystokinin receptor-like [Physella acuta]|uniref:cholecystokinin receptor-like n=1 Tax=Physella acuta TaxID=109671 RepID=UPI0027DDFE16|nr:cholecystokinin receptor-like [Physella acuta]